MNTKYPINGRYTTLGDIIQEYGRYSALPDDKLDYWNHKITAPFVHFIYNDFPTDSQNAIRPYDIVWFDDVYSETEKENTGKRMKLIQRQDSSTYSFDRPITAKEVKTRSNIQKGAFEFRFIIPSTTSTDGKDRFYYNYKTASGESVVMYALRTIIDEAKKNIEDADKTLELFFIGDTNSDGFRTIQPSTEHIFTYRYKITDNNSSIIEGNGQYNKSVYGNDSYALYRIAREFNHTITYNNNTFSFVCPETADTSTQTKTITDNDGTYTIEVKYLTWQGIDLPYEDTSVNDSKIKSQERSGFPLFNFEKLPDKIFNNDSATELKNDAYQYLGDYYWTYKYVQLPNYASQSATDFEYNSCITDNALSCYESISKSIGAQTKPSPADLCSILFDPTNYSQIKDTKNAENQYYKCLYFLLLFLNSQRFFVSYITAFEYINISNKSYAQREPVLRCDLNLIKPIESIKILSAQHFRETILPAGPLKPDTLISIIVYMKVKYKSIPNEKDFSTKINLTFEDLWNNKNITDTPDEEGIIGPWVTLINPFEHKWPEETKGVLTQTDDMDKYEGERYGINYFLQVNNNKLNTYSDCSLGTLMWPKGVQLQLPTADELEIMRDNTSDEEWFASISDSSTYPDKYTRWDDFKEEKLSPFGYLRLHNYADINQKKESQFTVTVPLLRCNNWYYKQGASTSIDSAMIYSYFNNIYLNAQIAEPEPAIGMYINTYAYGKQESNLQNILNKLNQLPIAAPSRIAQETISQIFGLKIGQAETLFFASGAKMIDEKTTADEKYNSSYTLYFEKLLSSKVWQRINPVSGAPENNCITSRNADDKVVEQYEVSNDYRGQKGTYTLGRVYIDVDDTLLHNPKDNTKCFYFKITNADHNNEGKIQVSFLDYKDSASKASSGELKLGFTQSITASFVIYNYNKPDTLDNIGTDKPSNTLTINNSVKQDTKTTDITIINDEHNKFIMSELSTTETYRLTKHHDNSDKKYLLHLFHYGVNSNNKLTVVFNNPEDMFRYEYPAIIDDTTKIISNAYSISLGDKFVTTTMSLTTDRTLYMALNPIYAFLHVNESTEKKLSEEDDKDCPPFQFQQSGIGYTQTNGQTTSCLISTQTPGCVISLVTDNVYITTDNIITGVNNDNNGSLSDYIKSQRERKQLIEIQINKYEFNENNNQVDLEGTQPTSTNIINTNTQPESQIFNITKDTLTIFTYKVTKYRKDTSKDTFYVSLATAGWKGKSSNIKIYCVQEPKIDGVPGKELGNPNNIQPSDDILQEITKMGQQFKNDTSVWICVPQQTLDLSSANTTNVCKHTQWDVDGKILSAQADGKISQTICISNKSITGVYLSYRTVYAIFETTESVTIPVQPEDTTITVSLTANPTIIEAKGGEFTLKYFVKKGNNPISDYGEPQPDISNFATSIKMSESINGEKSQTYKVGPNDLEKPITCKYKLKYEGKEKEVPITQKGSVYSAGITAKTETTSKIDPSGENIVITYYGIKNGDPISEGVKLTCSDNNITPPDGTLKDNKRVSTISIPANTSDKQKTYTFKVTYTYLTDKKKEQNIELTQDRIEYVVHCGLDTEKYSATLVAKPESGKDIFEIIYFAEKGTDKIYDNNTVTLEPSENYGYLKFISDVPNSEKMYRVRTYQFTENIEVDPRVMEFKAKCGSNESESLYITQVGANTEVIPQFDFAIINYKIQNDFETTDKFDIIAKNNKDNESSLLSDKNGINAIAGSDLDVWVTFSLDDDESKALLLPVRTASNDVIHLNLYGALNSSELRPYILGAGFSERFTPCINNNNKTVYISTPERYSTATNENGNVCTNYIRYAEDNQGGSGYESIYVNVANILNEYYQKDQQNNTLLGHKCKNLYIDLWGVMFSRRSTGKVSIDFNMYNFKEENVTDPNLTVNNYTFIPDSTKVDMVNKLNIKDGYATGYSGSSPESPTLISRITYPIRDGNPAIETKNLTYSNLNYCLLIPTDTYMKYVTSLVYDTIYYDNISNIKPYELDLRTIYYQDYTLKNGDPNKKVLNPYKKLTGHNFTLTNPSYNVKKDGVSIVMDISNNVKLENNKFTLNFPKLTEEASYEFTIYGITEPKVLNHETSLNDIKSYSITVELSKKR